MRDLELALEERERAVAAREAAVEQRMRLLGTHSTIAINCASTQLISTVDLILVHRYR